MSSKQIPLFDDFKPVSPRPEWGEQVLQPIPIHKDQATSPAELVPEEATLRITKNYDVSGSLLSRFLSFFSARGEKPIKLLHDTFNNRIGYPKWKNYWVNEFFSQSRVVDDR